MPELAVGIAIQAALSVPAAASVAVYNVVLGSLYITASLGLSFVSSLFLRQSQPKPEDVQTQTKQPVGARYRHYGRVKVSGNWAFLESKNGALHKVVAIGQGPFDAIEEFWIDDYLATRNATTGYVTNATSVSGEVRTYNNTVRILYRLGTGTDLAYSELTSVFPTWTSAHRGRQVASLYVTQFPVKDKFFQKLFPNVTNTNYRVILRGAIVENPITSVDAWNDAAAAVVRDYLYHPEGLRLPKALLTTPLAQSGWETAYTKSIAPYNLKAGGTEPRYRLWGSYNFEERCADVLTRLLGSCDGRLMITPDGGLTLDIGDIPTSPVVIDASMITGFTELGRGKDIMSTANTIRATFLDPDGDYQSGDADPWIDAADVALRGEIATSYEFSMSPSHSQCRRLMKIAAYRANPSWVGTFTCNLKAMKAFGERYVRITYPAFGIDETFEILNFSFDMGDYDIVRGVTIQVASMPAAAYEWDADQEEGEAPIAEDSDGTSTIPIPDNFNVTIDRKEVNSQLYPFARLTFDAPPNDFLTTQARGKLTSATEWNAIAIADGATEAESFLLEDGRQYEFQVRYVAISEGDWTDSIVVSAIADPTPPATISALVVTPNTNAIDTSWQSPNSNNFAATNIRRNTIDDEGTATLVHTEYGAANFPFTWQDAPLTSGTYYYWFRARNFSGVESTAIASGPITVT